jgi:hypothetical protein
MKISRNHEASGGLVAKFFGEGINTERTVTHSDWR